MAEVVAIGECMVEAALVPGGSAKLNYAGDTFNTAVYLRRLGLDVAYATALGSGDPFSQAIVQRMQDEGIDPALVTAVPGRLPGLYFIERDPDGQRRFFYWRGEAAVRDLFAVADLDRLEAALRESRLVYLSGITLAVIGEAGRTRLASMLASAAEAGAAVAFDTNYRPRLWSGPEAARAAIETLIPIARYVSTSDEDLAELYPDGAQATVARWADAGAEVILRTTSLAVTVRGGGATYEAPPQSPVAALDTTGAGDSFNAGYLAQRIRGVSRGHAVAAGRSLAEIVVQHLGAIIPSDAMPAGR